MARPGQAVWSNLANLGGVVKRRSHVKAHRRAVRRQAFIERLEPRVVLNGAPMAVPDSWYTTPQNTTLTVTTPAEARRLPQESGCFRQPRFVEECSDA
jgi:hypothetical protein